LYINNVNLILISLILSNVTLFQPFCYEKSINNNFANVINFYTNGCDNQKILKVVKKATELDICMDVNNLEEVENILSNYYTGRILKENSINTWEFVKKVQVGIGELPLIKAKLYIKVKKCYSIS